MPPVMIAGLYPYTRGGKRRDPEVTLREIPKSLETNPLYRNQLVVLAGDRASARMLEGFGLDVYRIFDDAPDWVHYDSAHKMKHWMCRWALGRFNEFLWVDWDTVLLRPLDDAFRAWCRKAETPKFIQIPDYWATVNCGVYYAGYKWKDAMDRSFKSVVQEPNDELLWASVLPSNICQRPEFWWGQKAVNIWNKDDFELVSPGTYFAHVKDLEWADEIRRASKNTVF